MFIAAHKYFVISLYHKKNLCIFEANILTCDSKNHFLMAAVHLDEVLLLELLSLLVYYICPQRHMMVNIIIIISTCASCALTSTNNSCKTGYREFSNSV